MSEPKSGTNGSAEPGRVPPVAKKTPGQSGSEGSAATPEMPRAEAVEAADPPADLRSRGPGAAATEARPDATVTADPSPLAGAAEGAAATEARPEADRIDERPAAPTDSDDLADDATGAEDPLEGGDTLVAQGEANVPMAALSEAEADSLVPQVQQVSTLLQDHSGEHDPLFEQKISLMATISAHESAILRARAMMKIIDEAIEKRAREKSKRERDDEERRVREELDKFSEIDDRIAELTRDLEDKTRRWKWLRDLFRRRRKD